MNQAIQRFEEARKGNFYRVDLVDFTFSTDAEGSDGPGHHHAVVTVPLQLGRMKRRSTVDDESVVQRFDPGADCREPLENSGETVALLDPELRSALDPRRPLCEGGHDREDGQLVDKGGNDVRLHIDPVEARSADPDGAHGLSRREVRARLYLDICSHTLKHVQKRRARGVQTDIRYGELGSGKKRRGSDEEGR